MPEPKFPHLNLSLKGQFEPFFRGGSRENPEVEVNRANPGVHSQKLKGTLDRLRKLDEAARAQREALNLPPIPSETGFLLRLPEGVDVESIVRSLGLELVAETEEGFMLVSSRDLQLTKLHAVIDEFATGVGSTVAGSSLLDIYENRDEPRRLKEILAPEALAAWPFEPQRIYVFDLAIQTAASTRAIEWPKVRRRKMESVEEFSDRREREWADVRAKAEDEWLENAEARVQELRPLIAHYEGVFLSGIISDSGKDTQFGVVFADSVQVRIRMNGEGFRDVVLNFPHLFEVTLPPEVQGTLAGQSDANESVAATLRSPFRNAPAVCVVDSGVQEGHRWLAAAVDSSSSRCFLPGCNTTDTADYVSPQGHGTRVAGAVLYPREIPKSGEIQPLAWIQNARVLNEQNGLPDNLPPERYLQQVVEHFCSTHRHTKIFNHSVNARSQCPRRRMSAWAAKIDELSHEWDVLFIQSSGNQNTQALSGHLNAGHTPPSHLLEDSMRIANPAQSLHALTVGSVAHQSWKDRDRRSFADQAVRPSGFSRTGFAPPWSVVKPEVVEFGGDLVYSESPVIISHRPEVSIELLNSTLHGAPPYSRDGCGTSFAAPKVAHLAAHLQTLFPDASPLLYRALIAQSARWPQWAENEPNKDNVLRWIGFGLPSLERATENTTSRVTLITADAQALPAKQFHLYTVRIPAEIRNAAIEAKLRIDVTLAYTALPRRTRARRTQYLETWLDWEASRLDEPAQQFMDRMRTGGRGAGKNIPWVLHTQTNFGQAEETARGHGTLQKDWAVIDAYQLPEEFSIAVRAHLGWNHRENVAKARYCLVVTIEALDVELPVYAQVEAENRVSPEIEVESRVEV